MSTTLVKPAEVERKWYLLDAAGKSLGHVAAEAAVLLRGKQKVDYTPNVDCGDFVVVINCDKIKVTGAKVTDKVYYRYTNHPGGLRQETFQEAMAKHPERVIQHAVKGMLPKGTLGRQMLKKLKVYTGSEHPHQAQNPRKIDLEA